MAVSSWKFSCAMSSLITYVCNPCTERKNLSTWELRIRTNKIHRAKYHYISILRAEFENPPAYLNVYTDGWRAFFLKSWTLTKTAISKWVFNPYRQELGFWKSRLMKINCICSRKWFESVYFDEAKQALNDNSLDSSNESCTRRTTKFAAFYFSSQFSSLTREFFMNTRKKSLISTRLCYIIHYTEGKTNWS